MEKQFELYATFRGIFLKYAQKIDTSFYKSKNWNIGITFTDCANNTLKTRQGEPINEVVGIMEKEGPFSKYTTE
ncbi:hypothetical protein DZB84_12435 [Bacillus sp. HNG]|nr:hypothetical protein DZB84_12435 [Bacillus sp. HNG]